LVSKSSTVTSRLHLVSRWRRCNRLFIINFLYRVQRHQFGCSGCTRTYLRCLLVRLRWYVYRMRLLQLCRSHGRQNLQIRRRRRLVTCQRRCLRRSYSNRRGTVDLISTLHQASVGEHVLQVWNRLLWVTGCNRRQLVMVGPGPELAHLDVGVVERGGWHEQLCGRWSCQDGKYWRCAIWGGEQANWWLNQLVYVGKICVVKLLGRILKNVARVFSKTWPTVRLW